jgi:sterol desaturase/sphingolipid hydroxylase (fatty acid hydroxylase superfamily)
MQDLKECQHSGFDYWFSWLTWPGLMLICISITAYGFSIDYPIMFFNVAYIFLIIALLILERAMPHEQQWRLPDGQNFANIAHTLTSKGTVQGLLFFSTVLGLTEVITPVIEPGNGIWPRHWPMAVQVIIGLIVSEFALYWAHRLSHEWPWLWRFHAVHHSVTKLWIVNTGRFHFVDSLVSIVLGTGVLVLVGAPLEVVKWQASITAFIGMLTHCNVQMRFGLLSWFFNTPSLHRWHHSLELAESDRNYGENLMLWDHVFGTYFNPERRPPTTIGINAFMPPKFRHQLIWPFLTEASKKRVETTYVQGG